MHIALYAVCRIHQRYPMRLWLYHALLQKLLDFPKGIFIVLSKTMCSTRIRYFISSASSAALSQARFAVPFPTLRSESRPFRSSNGIAFISTSSAIMAVATSHVSPLPALNERSGEQPKSAQADWDAISRLSADFSYQPELQFKATLQPPW